MNGETVPHHNGVASPWFSLMSGATACGLAASGEAALGLPTVFMVGESPAMHEVFDQIRGFATCDVPVLITGESGTGKELVARAIHHHSARATGPFVALNCAAVPATLIASELFGYEKGAFTGAVSRKRGHIEHAQGGTLFLDEIGDMPIDLQALLLRFLQEGEILRVGGRQPIKVNVRVVAATNVRLHEAIATGKLREDLYYRLNGLTIDLPPLRGRDGDVELLASYFLGQIGRELQRHKEGFTPQAMAAMLAHRWPGNVRELIATLRRAVLLAKGPLIDVCDLRLEQMRTVVAEIAKPAAAPPKRAAVARIAPSAAPAPKRPARTRPAPSSGAERAEILNALQDNRFNMTRTARALGVSRATLYRMLSRNGIELAQQFLVRDAQPGQPAP
jgi:DNA-binding NtrC family response regulator